LEKVKPHSPAPTIASHAARLCPHKVRTRKGEHSTKMSQVTLMIVSGESIRNSDLR
jgi:hypothetical protein